MVDEFSSFARMPKPVFREESLAEIARQALFLHEVAHPEIALQRSTRPIRRRAWSATAASSARR